MKLSSVLKSVYALMGIMQSGILKRKKKKQKLCFALYELYFSLYVTK